MTLEDGTTVNGFGSAVADYLTENHKTNKLSKIGISDRFVTHGTIPDLQKLCNMDVDSVVEKAKVLLTNKES